MNLARVIHKQRLLATILLLLISTGIVSSLPLQKNDSIRHTVYAARGSGDFNFGAVGDWGCNSNTNNTVANIVSKKIELVIGLGDYSYEPTADCWLKIVHPIEQKMKIVVGNHEVTVFPNNRTIVFNPYRSSLLLQQYMNQFGLTKQYYSFNYHNVHFLMMSTDVGSNKGSDQYKFVANDLAKASTNSSTKWIIVCFHHPMYTSPGAVSPVGYLFTATYHPLFDKYKVDLVLQGHNHNYQRSYPIEYNPSSPATPLVTTAEKNNYTKPTGPLFIIIGTGGEFPMQPITQSPFIVTQRAQVYGFLKLDVNNGGQSMIGAFYGNDGKIEDYFRIDK